MAIFHSCQHTATVLVLLQIKTCILSLPCSPFFHLTSKTLFRNLSEAGSLRQNIQVPGTFSFQSCKDLYTNQFFIRSLYISFYKKSLSHFICFRSVLSIQNGDKASTSHGLRYNNLKKKTRKTM